MLESGRTQWIPSARLAILFALSLLSPIADSLQSPRDDAIERCLERSGLSRWDIASVKYRNANCTLDCIMKQGTVLTYYANDGTACWKDENRCLLGACRALPKSIGPMVEQDLQQLEIAIHSARVPDMDFLPFAGGSDTFILVQAVENAAPSYKHGEAICYTYIVQDNNNPRWNFKCKSLPVTNSIELKFSAFDSDRPFVLDPDHLGWVSESVSNLLLMGRTKLRLQQENEINFNGKSYYVEVEVTSNKFI